MFCSKLLQSVCPQDKFQYGATEECRTVPENCFLEKNNLLSPTFHSILPFLFRFPLFCIPIEPPFPSLKKGGFHLKLRRRNDPRIPVTTRMTSYFMRAYLQFFSHPKVPLFHVFTYVLSPSKPLNSKQTTFCSHIVDASAEIEAELIPVQLPLFSKIL